MGFNAVAVSDSSSSSIVINADTNQIIYQKNPYEKLPMASTTKIMTGLLLAESGRLDEMVRCTKEMVTVEGSALGLKAGDYISGRDLLYGLMLASGNDAANVIAYFLGGSIEGFAEMMNEKAAQLGLRHTNFVTPSGLDSNEHYTTAYDLAVLAACAIRNDEFYKACSSYTAKIKFGDPPVQYTFKNHNRLLKELDICVGVKTGFTKKSGRCLVTAAESEGRRVIAVTLNDPNDWQDHKSLLNYGIEKVDLLDFNPDNEITVPVINGTKESVSLTFESFTVGNSGGKSEDFKTEIVVPQFLYAPLNIGSEVGKVYITYQGNRVAETALYITDSVDKEEPKTLRFTDKLIIFIKQMIINF